MKTRDFLKYFFIFLVALSVFVYLGWSNVLADPDSFYHAKIASLMAGGNLVFESFPWLAYTTVNQHFADHHFIYHILMIPFVKWLDPLLGAKIAGIFFSSLVFVVFYWFFKKENIRYPVFFSLAPLLVGSFIFRLGLVKAQPLAIIMLVICLYLLFEKKTVLLFFASFIFVWTHASFPLVIVAWFLYCLAGAFEYLIKQDQCEKIFFNSKKDKKFFKELGKTIWLALKLAFGKENMKLGLACVFGIIAGLIINPYFPSNLSFYYEQIVKIALVGMRDVVRSGSEWMPFDFFDLVTSSTLAFVALIISVASFFIGIKSQNKKSWTLFLLMLVFFVLTLRSKRNIEFFVPSVFWFSAFSINSFFKVKETEIFFRILKRFLKERLFQASLIIFCLALILIGAKNIYDTSKALKGQFKFNHFKMASEWLLKNSKPGEIVFHGDWDDFPFLFYNNSKNYYIVGLDPTFMYDYSPEMYKTWEQITLGNKKDNLYEIIKKDFKASYIFIGNDQKKFKQNILPDSRFWQVYQDSEATIYKVL